MPKIRSMIVAAALLTAAAPAFADDCQIPGTCQIGVLVKGVCQPLQNPKILAHGLDCESPFKEYDGKTNVPGKCTNTGECSPSGLKCTIMDPKEIPEGPCTSGSTYDSNGRCAVVQDADGTPCKETGSTETGFCENHKCITRIVRPPPKRCKRTLNLCRLGGYDVDRNCKPAPYALEDTTCICPVNHKYSTCSKGACQCTFPPDKKNPLLECRCGGVFPAHCKPCPN